MNLDSKYFIEFIKDQSYNVPLAFQREYQGWDPEM